MDGIGLAALIVRPTRAPSGMKVFRMEWRAEEQRIDIVHPMSGERILTLDGRWTGEEEAAEAVMACAV